MHRCRTRRSTSPTETSPSTSAPRSSPEAISRLRSRPRSDATSTSRRAARGLRRDHRPGRDRHGPQGPLHRRPPGRVGQLRRRSRVEHFRVYRGRTGKYVLHVERSADCRWSTPKGKPAGWRGYLGIGDISYGSVAGGGDPRGRRDRSRSSATRSRPSSTTWSPRSPAAGRRGPRHLSARAPCLVGPRDGASDDRHATPARRDPRRAGCASRTASRSSSTASTSRSPRAPSSPCSDRTAPARRRPSTSSRRSSPPTPARCVVGGHDVAREPDAVRAVIGLTGQFSAVDGLFTGEENLRLMADLRHLGKDEGRRRVAELLERFDLVDAAEKPVADLLGRHAPAPRPRDDPRSATRGSSSSTSRRPASTRAAGGSMWDIVRDLVAGGVTIFLTTQYLEEADRLADRIARARPRPDRRRGHARPSSSASCPGGHVRLEFADAAELDRAAGVLGRRRPRRGGA